MDNKKMNLWMFLVVAFIAGIIIGGAVVYITRNGLSGSSFLNLYPPKSSPDWLVKVDDYVITKQDLDEGYQNLLKQLSPERLSNMPPDAKKQFFENMLDYYVISIKALNDGVLKSPETQRILQSYMRQLLSEIYVRKYIPQNAFLSSKMERDEFYLQHKADLDRLGMKSDQLRQYIDLQIGRQKEQIWLQQFVTTLKESLKIQRNNDLLTQEGVTTLTLPQNNLILPMPTNSVNTNTNK